MISLVGVFIGSDEIPPDEVGKRRDAALLRALSTPHKRQSEMKIGRVHIADAGQKKRERSPKAKSE
jgi:hypothetical protein